MNEWEWNLLEDKTGNLDHVEIDGIAVKTGDRVRLRPKEGGDILDIALRGQVAIIESIEEDYEGARHICVVVEDDPGRDLGMMRQPGHRFFFTPAEIEPLPQNPNAPEEDAKARARRLFDVTPNPSLASDAAAHDSNTGKRVSAQPPEGLLLLYPFEHFSHPSS